MYICNKDEKRKIAEEFLNWSVYIYTHIQSKHTHICVFLERHKFYKSSNISQSILSVQ